MMFHFTIIFDHLTPLHLACSFGHLNIVKMLLENPNIDLSILTAKSQTVLHLICGFHNELDELENTTTSNIPKKSIAEKEEEVLDIVKLLVNHINIDINSTDVFY